MAQNFKKCAPLGIEIINFHSIPIFSPGVWQCRWQGHLLKHRHSSCINSPLFPQNMALSIKGRICWKLGKLSQSLKICPRFREPWAGMGTIDTESNKQGQSAGVQFYWVLQEYDKVFLFRTRLLTLSEPVYGFVKFDFSYKNKEKNLHFL